MKRILLASFLCAAAAATPSAGAKNVEQVLGIPYGGDVEDLKATFAGAETPLDMGYNLLEIPFALPSFWCYSVYATPKTGRIHTIGAWFPAPELMVLEMSEEQEESYLAGLSEMFSLPLDGRFLPALSDLIADSVAKETDWREIRGAKGNVLAREFPRDALVRAFLERQPGSGSPLRAFRSGNRRLFIASFDSGVFVLGTDKDLLRTADREAKAIERENRRQAARPQPKRKPDRDDREPADPSGVVPDSFLQFQREQQEYLFGKIPEGYPEPDTEQQIVFRRPEEWDRMTQDDLVQFPAGRFDVKPAGRDKKKGIPIYRTMPMGSQVPGRFLAPVFIPGPDGGWEYVEFPPRGKKRNELFSELCARAGRGFKQVEAATKMENWRRSVEFEMKHQQNLSELDALEHENKMREIRAGMADLQADHWSRMTPKYVPDYFTRWDGTTVTHDPGAALRTGTPFVPFSTIIKAPKGFYK